MSPATRDSEKISSSDSKASALWSWYTFKYSRVLHSTGKLKKMVELAHKKGRMIRLYSVPESKKIWKKLEEIQVDLIGVDNLKKWSNYDSTSH